MLHHGCDLNVRICTKHCIFLVNGGSVAEKPCLACATVAGVAALAWNHARSACAMVLRVPGAFFSSFVDAVLLCFACEETQSASQRCVLQKGVAILW